MNAPVYQQDVRLMNRSLVLYPLSDVHIGADGHNKPALQKKINEIASQPENHRVLLLGDLADMAIIGSKGHSHGATTAQEELDELVRILKPIASRVDLIIPGNHEARALRATGLDFTQQLAVIIGRAHTYRPGATVVRYNLGTHKSRVRTKAYANYSVRIFCHHGHGGSRAAGGKLNKVLDLQGMYSDADVYLMGHVHDQISRIGTLCHGWPIKTKKQYYVVTGCYLGGEGVRMEQYGMDKAYEPVAAGSPVIFVNGAHGNSYKIKVELS